MLPVSQTTFLPIMVLVQGFFVVLWANKRQTEDLTFDIGGQLVCP